VVPTVEMEWDCAVPGCDGEGQADGVKVGWQWRPRGHEIFWQHDGIEVKILWLGFKDRVAGSFINGQQ
jgi:hypothetical protein